MQRDCAADTNNLQQWEKERVSAFASTSQNIALHEQKLL